LIRDEIERRTEIGLEIHQLVNSGQLITPDLIVQMLKNIIYNGDENNNKFLLTGFPENPEGLRIFEENCANITAIIYAAGPEPIVEVLHNNLN
jgi:adenylate kinase family enzyme